MDIANHIDPPDRPRKTELQKLQEKIQRTLQPIREMEALLKRSSPGYPLQELMRQFEPPRQIREMLERSAIPPRFQDLIAGSPIAAQAQSMLDGHLAKNTLASICIDNEALRRATRLNTFTEVSKQYERYLKPSWNQQNFLEQMNRHLYGGFTAKEFALQLKHENPTFKAMEEAKKSLDRLWSQFADIDFSQFKAESTEEQEAAVAAEQITIAATSEPTLKEAVDQIIAAIEAQQHPAVKVLLWFYFKIVLNYLISGAVGGVMGVYITAAMTPGASPQAEAKVVKEVARQVVGAPELLMEYRYVSAKVLIVRQNARALSPEIARLTFGNPVKLLKKEKDFALVVWSDRESGAEVHGWVFARYLGKFN